jgi:membrane-associated phospholipid phosphatase
MPILSRPPEPPPANEALPWQRQAAHRFSTLWLLKACGTAAFMPLFFLGYFGVLQYPLSPATVMPLTVVDAWIPFTPAAFGFYVALWFYVSLPPAFLPDLRQLVAYGLWIAALCLCGLAIFWLWPTAVPRADIDWTAYPEMALIKGIDLAGNACPSLHVATAVFSAVWLGHLLKSIGAPRLLVASNWLLCAAIVWSTLATRQHVFLDVLAGAALGLIFAALALRSVARQASPPPAPAAS